MELKPENYNHVSKHSQLWGRHVVQLGFGRADRGSRTTFPWGIDRLPSVIADWRYPVQSGHVGSRRPNDGPDEDSLGCTPAARWRRLLLGPLGCPLFGPGHRIAVMDRGIPKASESVSGAVEIPGEWLEEFEAAARRPLRQRFRYAFIKTYKPVLDDASYRSFDSMAEYRRCCEENLPDWLGYGRV